MCVSTFSKYLLVPVKRCCVAYGKMTLTEGSWQAPSWDKFWIQRCSKVRPHARRSALAITCWPHSLVFHEFDYLGTLYYQAHFTLVNQDILIGMSGTTMAGRGLRTERFGKTVERTLINMPATHKRASHTGTSAPLDIETHQAYQYYPSVIEMVRQHVFGTGAWHTD